MQENIILENNIQNESIDTPLTPPTEFNKRDFIFAGLSALSCVFIVLFGLFGSFALGFSLSALMLICVLSVYICEAENIRVKTIICGILVIANILNFVFTSNGSVRFFTVVELFFLSLVLFDSLASKEKAGVIKRIAVTFLSLFANIPFSLKGIFGKKKDGSGTIGKVLLGAACALPVLLIIVPLLSSADVAFGGIINLIIGNSVPTTMKISLGLATAIFIVSYGFTVKKNKYREINLQKPKAIETIFVASFLSVVSIAYLLYLFSQLAYFFSAFSSILPEGYEFTVAIYARRGFFELCAISVINLIIITISLLLSSQDGKINTSIKLLCSFISFFTLIICLTAISKMVLYIDSFGMTVLRITTSAFMVFLIIVFIAVMLKIYISKIKVMKVALFSAAIILVILGSLNVNAVAAKYNYERYMDKSLPNIDISAMADLGDEGVPYLVKLAESNDYTVNDLAKGYLKQYYNYTYFDLSEEQLKLEFNKETLDKNIEYKSLKYFSVPKYKAYKALYEYAENNPQSFRYNF